MDALHWEIICGVLTAANIFLQMSVRNEVLKLQISIAREYLTKDDFKVWTRQSKSLPSFETETM